MEMELTRLRTKEKNERFSKLKIQEEYAKALTQFISLSNTKNEAITKDNSSLEELIKTTKQKVVEMCVELSELKDEEDPEDIDPEVDSRIANILSMVIYMLNYRCAIKRKTKESIQKFRTPRSKKRIQLVLSKPTLTALCHLQSRIST